MGAGVRFDSKRYDMWVCGNGGGGRSERALDGTGGAGVLGRWGTRNFRGGGRGRLCTGFFRAGVVAVGVLGRGGLCVGRGWEPPPLVRAVADRCGVVVTIY